MEGKIYDLDKIALSLDIYKAWKYFIVEKVVNWYIATGKVAQIKTSDIPDEQFRAFPDGNAEIFIKMPDGMEISLKVPKEHWAFIETLNN